MARAARALGVALLCALAVALGMPHAMAADEGLLRLAHLSPDTPAVDVYVDSVADPGAGLTFPGVDYGTVSAYQSLPPGTYTVSMRTAGADATTPPVLSTTVDVTPGTARTVAGVGSFSALGLEILDDDMTLPPAGSARVRVVAASVTAGAADVAMADGAPVASGLTFGRTSDYVEVPAGQRALRVSPGGGTPTDLPVELAAGSVYTLLLLDRPDGRLAVQPVLDAGSPGVVPVGGVETGAGGTSGGSGRTVVAAAVAALATAGLLGTAGRRRTRTGA